MPEQSLNSMHPHTHFEELCALAAIGDIRESEWVELDDHLQSCESCRAARQDFLATVLVLDQAAASTQDLVTEEMTARFVARARSAGIPLSTDIHRLESHQSSRTTIRAGLRRAMILCAVAAAILVGVFSWLHLQNRTDRGAFNKETQQVKQKTTAQEPETSVSGENQQLRSQLAGAQEKEAALTAQIAKQEQSLDSLRQEKQQLAQRYSELSTTNDAIRADQAERNTEISKLNADLASLRSQEANQRADLLAAEAELKAEQQKLADLKSELTAEHQLNAALTEVRDLVRDRDVHVVNILREPDVNGNLQPAFGRVFYADGRRFDFYAFDLAAPQEQIAKTAFYVWKEMSGHPDQVAKLGKLQIDSEKDGRWLLRITDPALITNLRTVFVTREPDTGTVARPTGKRFLYALLEKQRSHP